MALCSHAGNRRSLTAVTACQSRRERSSGCLRFPPTPVQSKLDERVTSALPDPRPPSRRPATRSAVDRQHSAQRQRARSSRSSPTRSRALGARRQSRGPSTTADAHVGACCRVSVWVRRVCGLPVACRRSERPVARVTSRSMAVSPLPAPVTCSHRCQLRSGARPSLRAPARSRTAARCTSRRVRGGRLSGGDPRAPVGLRRRF
jgi:hypothetical protein